VISIYYISNASLHYLVNNYWHSTTDINISQR